MSRRQGLMRFASGSQDTSPSINRRQPLLTRTRSVDSSHGSNFAEMAGVTAAECAAICCCCPCGIVPLLILAMYKLPAGLCRRALKKKRLRKLIKKGMIPQRTKKCQCGCDDIELQIHPLAGSDASVPGATVEGPLTEKENEEMVTLEKEMWETFVNTGFFRSPSQRELPAGVNKSSGMSPRGEVSVHVLSTMTTTAPT